MRNLVSFDALVRLRDTRKRLAALTYAARIPILVPQLQVLRGTYPDGMTW